jgi:hypothetical protein
MMIRSSGPARFQGTGIFIKRSLDIFAFFYKPAPNAKNRKAPSCPQLFSPAGSQQGKLIILVTKIENLPCGQPTPGRRLDLLCHCSPPPKHPTYHPKNNDRQL